MILENKAVLGHSNPKLSSNLTLDAFKYGCKLVKYVSFLRETNLAHFGKMLKCWILLVAILGFYVWADESEDAAEDPDSRVSKCNKIIRD